MRIVLACTMLAAACHRAPPAATPDAALSALIAAGVDHDESAARRYLTARTVELMTSIETTARSIHATNVPEHVLASFLENFARQAPALTGVEPHGDAATVAIRYRSGHAARLDFRREDGAWKLDLTKDLESSLALLEGARGRLEALSRGEIIQGDDDD